MIDIYLNQAGDLYREPRAKHCYPMANAKNRYKIIRYFAENKLYDYYPTPEIMSNLDYKDKITLRKDIGKLNNIIQGKISLKDKENIIEGRGGSGYRINPKYKIILKNK